MAFINENENRKFIGRKLILDWGRAKLERTKENEDIQEYDQ